MDVHSGRYRAGAPVGGQRARDIGHMVHEAPVPGCEGADRRIGVVQPGQAGQVLMEVTVGRPDDHRGAVHHVVAGQQQGVLLNEPAHMIGRMPRSVHCTKGEHPVRTGDRPALVDSLVGIETLGPIRGAIANSGSTKEVALLVFIGVFGVSMWLALLGSRIRRGWSGARLVQAQS